MVDKSFITLPSSSSEVFVVYEWLPSVSVPQSESLPFISAVNKISNTSHNSEIYTVHM